ncbi:hypothetical protein CONCODRAFT_1773, partial [Conidiobolus coronatus NRRL 28638]
MKVYTFTLFISTALSIPSIVGSVGPVGSIGSIGSIGKQFGKLDVGNVVDGDGLGTVGGAAK